MFEQEKIRIIDNIKTTMEMENQILSDSDLELLHNFADNKISIEDAMKTIKNTIY